MITHSVTVTSPTQPGQPAVTLELVEEFVSQCRMAGVPLDAVIHVERPLTSGPRLLLGRLTVTHDKGGRPHPLRGIDTQ